MELSVEQTAAQLRCPHDEAGTAFGQAMNLRNLTQIVSAFAAARLQNGDNILETGCGNGGLLGYILSQADDLHYTGLEISPLMHEQAQAFNEPFIAPQGRRITGCMTVARCPLPMPRSTKPCRSIPSIFGTTRPSCWPNSAVC